MCFPHKDHRMNMLHSLSLVSLICGILVGILAQWTAWIGVVLAILGLACTNKCCFMFLCMTYGISALCCFFMVGAQTAVTYFPDSDLRGVLKDLNTTDHMMDLTGTDMEFMHWLMLAALVVGCTNGCFQFMLAYYSWEVYHYQGPVDDLRYGPGHDGRGNVYGIHDAEHQPMVSAY
eukprot:gnl/TRDRNA2_/TRDRNA2_39380_c0_seq1.p1 gnl/TRDRNA2_/TRDRNA2_39380_c0~~gnl/TRDRNA2_/TRDRNA2_39380_c0_seq1.p1  ORF type:complete len:200 (-),score=28.45 gnl/TRDRNA2_/TRDRNA2_39380_c0_seq1:89-616(-)